MVNFIGPGINQFPNRDEPVSLGGEPVYHNLQRGGRILFSRVEKHDIPRRRATEDTRCDFIHRKILPVQTVP